MKDDSVTHKLATRPAVFSVVVGGSDLKFNYDLLFLEAVTTEDGTVTPSAPLRRASVARPEAAPKAPKLRKGPASFFG